MADEENSPRESFDLPPMQALQAFERVARRGSFALAAQDMGRTPSAISHAIKELELRLGVPLFLREGRKTTLTAAGAELLPFVRTGLSAFEAGLRRLKQEQQPHLMRISALPLFTSSVILPNLARFRKRFPDLDLRIETTNAYADIQNGEVDAAIRFGAARVDDLAIVPLIRVFGVPVCAPSYLDNAPPLRRAEDVTRHTLIHVAQTPDAWAEWLRAQGAPAPPKGVGLSFDSYLGALDAAKRGVGLVLAMEPIIQGFPGYGTDIVPALDVEVGSQKEFNFVCRKGDLGTRKVRSTLRWLQDALSPYAEHATANGK